MSNRKFRDLKTDAMLTTDKFQCKHKGLPVDRLQSDQSNFLQAIRAQK
jgi:hypothetical protein